MNRLTHPVFILVIAQIANAQSVIFNGDFEEGMSGWSTHYRENATLGDEGTYRTAQAGDVIRHPVGNLPVPSDHTPWGRKLVYFNGHTVSNQTVLSQSFLVTPDTEFLFSMWVRPWSGVSSQLSVKIDGTELGVFTTLTPGYDVHKWQEFTAVWRSGLNPRATLTIVEKSLIWRGNDFAIDDITLIPRTSAEAALSLELTGQNETTQYVKVVGAWQVDGLQGWSWGVCHDAREVSITSCAGYGPFQSPCHGDCPAVACPDDMAHPGPIDEPAEFHVVSVTEDGFSQAVVLDMEQRWSLPATNRFEFLTVAYSLLPGVRRSRLDFCSTIVPAPGSPPVSIVFTVGGNSFTPMKQEGLYLERYDPEFLRGDANVDGRIDIADPIFVLEFLFAGGATPVCLDAADANDDGAVPANIADAITLLDYLFANGSGSSTPLPEPTGECGFDPTDDALDCRSYSPCE